MRRSQTPSEDRLCAELRGGRLGVAFRRRVVIGRYIADFASSTERLIVEVDGARHGGRVHLDARRDVHLRQAGYLTVRIPAALVESNLAAAVELIRASL